MEKENQTIHRGEWIKEEIRKKDRTQSDIANSFNISLATLWRQFQDSNLSFVKLKLIADELKIDLRKSFPETEDLYVSTNIEYEGVYKLIEAEKKIASLEEDLKETKKLNEFLQKKLMECEQAR